MYPALALHAQEAAGKWCGATYNGLPPLLSPRSSILTSSTCHTTSQQQPTPTAAWTHCVPVATSAPSCTCALLSGHASTSCLMRLAPASTSSLLLAERARTMS